MARKAKKSFADHEGLSTRSPDTVERHVSVADADGGKAKANTDKIKAPRDVKAPDLKSQSAYSSGTLSAVIAWYIAAASSG